MYDTFLSNVKINKKKRNKNITGRLGRRFKKKIQSRKILFNNTEWIENDHGN